MIDWQVATSTGVRWVRPGPQVSMTEARKVVAELRQLAAVVAEPVRELTGLPGSPDDGNVAIVDRPGWIRANVDGFRVVLDPLAQRMAEGGMPQPGSVITAVGSRVTGMQAGLILAYLAGRVLGQYELFLPPDPDGPAGEAPAGRLTLVAPNIVMVERELDVNPHDFRRWVCLHEETHRVQFTAVPWMRDHLHELMGQIVGAVETDPAAVVTEALSRIGGIVSGKTDGSLLDLFS
ncbi:MAG TPA: zinc-dependent metalloprotease, partial [Streptosporangiaceae bacterium]